MTTPVQLEVSGPEATTPRGKLHVAMLALAVTALALAGCSAQLQPLQVKIDAPPIDVHLDRITHPSEQVTISDLSSVDTIQVEVRGTPTGNQTSVFLVTIKDSSGVQLAQERLTIVVVSQGNQTGSNTTSNTTVTNNTTTNNVVIINVDVRGKNNVVVVTEALEGSATLSIAAHGGKATTTTTGGNTTAPTAPATPPPP